jgi:hypothetical protein
MSKTKTAAFPVYPDPRQAPPDHQAYLIATFGRMVLHSVKDDPNWSDDDRGALQWAAEALAGAHLTGGHAQFSPKHLVAAFLIGAHATLPNSLYRAAVQQPRMRVMSEQRRRTNQARNAAKDFQISEARRAAKRRLGYEPKTTEVVAELSRQGRNISRRTVERSLQRVTLSRFATRP